MKQTGKHNNFDQWLYNSMHDAEVSPPSFDALFPEEAPKPFWAFQKKAVVGLLSLLLLSLPVYFISQPIEREAAISQGKISNEPTSLSDRGNSPKITQPASEKLDQETGEEEFKTEESIVSEDPKVVDPVSVASPQVKKGGQKAPLASTYQQLDRHKPMPPISPSQNITVDEEADAEPIGESSALAKLDDSRSNIVLIHKEEEFKQQLPLLQLNERVKVVEPKLPNKLYVGGATGLNFNHIINHNIYGLYSQSKVSFVDSWAPAFGVYGGKKILPKVYLELGFNFLVEHNLKREFKLRGDEIIHSTDLLYHQFPVLLRYQHFQSSNQKFAAYVESGMQYARLLSAKISVDDSRLSIYRRFQEHEYSLMLGYSFAYRFSPRFSAEGAFRARIGSGINDQQWLVQNAIHRQSHNMNLAFQFRLNYWLKR